MPECIVDRRSFRFCATLGGNAIAQLQLPFENRGLSVKNFLLSAPV
jgi:hypothetical protein